MKTFQVAFRVVDYDLDMWDMCADEFNYQVGDELWCTRAESKAEALEKFYETMEGTSVVVHEVFTLNF